MSYNGGKGGAGVYQKIINAMPKHTVYIETHLGGGSIMRKKKQVSCNIGIDIDTAVINSFKYSIDKMPTDERDFILRSIIDKYDGGRSAT